MSSVLATIEGAVSGLTGLVAPDAPLLHLATGATWSEGPVWVPERGSVLWSDIHGDRILEWSPGSGQGVYRTGVEFTNGRTLDRDGSILQCSHGRRRVERDRDGTITEVVALHGGRRFNSPNDVVVARDGSIWFTDPAYGITAPGEGHPGVSAFGDCWVFRFDPATGEVRPVVIDVESPNGLAFSPDESILYVSDTSRAPRPDGNHHIRAYDLRDGRCKNGRTFATIDAGIPDGFRVDTEGNVWTSSAEGVLVHDSAGALLGRIAVPEVTANVCFGGEDGTTLFIAATTSLYSIATSARDAAQVG